METKLSQPFCWYSADGVHDVVVLGVGLDLVVQHDLETVVLHRLDDLVDDVAAAQARRHHQGLLEAQLEGLRADELVRARPQQRPRERVELLDRERLEKFVYLHWWPLCMHGWIGPDVRPVTAPPGAKDRRGGGGEPSDRAGAVPHPVRGAGGGGNVPSDLGRIRQHRDDGRGRDRAVGVRECACPAGRRACRVRSGRRARWGRRRAAAGRCGRRRAGRRAAAPAPAWTGGRSRRRRARGCRGRGRPAQSAAVMRCSRRPVMPRACRRPAPPPRRPGRLALRTDGLWPLSLSGSSGAAYRPTTDPPRRTRGRGAERTPTEDAVVEETLVEEVSIDGMCGVY